MFFNYREEEPEEPLKGLKNTSILRTKYCYFDFKILVFTV